MKPTYEKLEARVRELEQKIESDVAFVKSVASGEAQLCAERDTLKSRLAELEKPVADGEVERVLQWLGSPPWNPATGEESKSWRSETAALIRRLHAENAGLRQVHTASYAYLVYLRKSVNVGPLTNNPMREATLLKAMMAAVDAAQPAALAGIESGDRKGGGEA